MNRPRQYKKLYRSSCTGLEEKECIDSDKCVYDYQNERCLSPDIDLSILKNNINNIEEMFDEMYDKDYMVIEYVENNNLGMLKYLYKNGIDLHINYSNQT